MLVQPSARRAAMVRLRMLAMFWGRSWYECGRNTAERGCGGPPVIVRVVAVGWMALSEGARDVRGLARWCRPTSLGAPDPCIYAGQALQRGVPVRTAPSTPPACPLC